MLYVHCIICTLVCFNLRPLFIQVCLSLYMRFTSQYSIEKLERKTIKNDTLCILSGGSRGGGRGGRAPPLPKK